MNTLTAIVVASLVGGALSAAAVGAAVVRLNAGWIPDLVALAVGALLGAAFLEVLPHALEGGFPPAALMGTVLGGILLFFLLEKLVIWRHSHDHGGVGHAHADAAGGEPGAAGGAQASPAAHALGGAAGPERGHGASGWMVIIGDAFHNFCDGVLIAAAFVADFNVGLITAAAILAHEIPQEVGDVLVLVHAGFSRTKAFVFNLLTSLATLVGGIIAYFALAAVEEWVPALLAIGAASMIYVAVADLIPHLHRRVRLRDTVKQLALIGAGVGVVVLLRELFAH